LRRLSSRAMIPALTLPLAVALLTSVASTISSASGSPEWITITRCDTVVIAGKTYPQVTFAVNAPEERSSVCIFFFAPRVASAPADTCRAVLSSAPAGWRTGIDSSNGRVVWLQDNKDNQCILPGTSLGDFQIVLTRAHQCCYDFALEGAVFDLVAHGTLCMNCDHPVPAHLSSWGFLKAIYRE